MGAIERLVLYINTVRMWRLLRRCAPYILAVTPRTLLKLATPLLNLFEQYDMVRFWPFDASFRRFRRVEKKVCEQKRFGTLYLGHGARYGCETLQVCSSVYRDHLQEIWARSNDWFSRYIVFPAPMFDTLKKKLRKNPLRGAISRTRCEIRMRNATRM